MSTLRCYACDREAQSPLVRCVCGEPLWFDIESRAVNWPDASSSDLWGYADLLPTAAPRGLAATVGGTSLFRTERLDEYAGCHVWLKDETINPTGSFKDRGSAVGVAWASSRSYGTVGTVSHGNMAISVAAMAASVGLDALVLVPADVPEERLVHAAHYGPTLLRVEGNYGQLYTDSLALGEEHGAVMLNSDVPLRTAGAKTIAYEICRHGRVSPDAIVLPVSSGGHASAIWKGCRELQAAGLLDRIPRLLLIQAAGCGPIAAADRDGRETVSPVEPAETIAYSIANADPPSGTRALTAARETGGTVISVPDDEIREALDRLGTRTGMSVEPASATALAGLRSLARSGRIDPEDEVVLVMTGTGMRDAAGATPDVPVVHRSELGKWMDEAL